VSKWLASLSLLLLVFNDVVVDSKAIAELGRTMTGAVHGSCVDQKADYLTGRRDSNPRASPRAGADRIERARFQLDGPALLHHISTWSVDDRFMNNRCPER
jgi:hypothetical protein